MKDAAEFGMNKTPAQLHPVMTQAMIEGCDEFPLMQKILHAMPLRCVEAILKTRSN
jgi:hypothetical protein